MDGRQGRATKREKYRYVGSENGAVLQQDKEFYAGEYSTRITLSGSIELAPGPVFCRSAAVSKLSLPLPLSASPVLAATLLRALPTVLHSFSCSRSPFLSLSLSLSFSHFLCLYPYAFAFFSSKRFGRRASIVPSVKRMHFKYCRTMKIQRRQWYKQFPSVKNRGGGRKIIFVLFAVSRSLLSYEGGRAC